MIEYPEALTLSRQLNNVLEDKTVARVYPPTKPHKFCWFNGNPADYNNALCGLTFSVAEAFGIYVELGFQHMRLCINDGVNVRLSDCDDTPKDYQLMIEFHDGTRLVFSVAMYGGIILHKGDYDNEYYLRSRAAESPCTQAFPQAFYDTFAKCKPTLSAKAFLATEQRFPGIGNGVLQDILFEAGINPKRKIATFDKEDIDKLLSCTESVLHRMADSGGRDTEKDLYGKFGGYVTRMSKNSLADGCPVCRGEITKEAYLGGSVYYCANCQPLHIEKK